MVHRSKRQCDTVFPGIERDENGKVYGLRLGILHRFTDYGLLQL
jgi:hypothetical protein